MYLSVTYVSVKHEYFEIEVSIYYLLCKLFLEKFVGLKALSGTEELQERTRKVRWRRAPISALPCHRCSLLKLIKDRVEVFSSRLSRDG